MLFENNGTLQLEHMTDAPPEIDQYNDNHKIAVLQK